jgi:hypothetical protein
MVTLSLVALAAQTYSLRFVPKVGHEETMVVKTTIQASGTTLVQEFGLKEKILEVAPDGGYTAQTSGTLYRMTVNGETRNLPSPPMRKVRNDRDGQPIDKEAPKPIDPLTYTLSSVVHFVPPPKPLPLGATFKNVVRFDATRAHTDANVTYKLAVLTKYRGEEALKVSFTYREAKNPIVFTGYFLFRTRDFLRVQMRASSKNLVIQDGLTGTATMAADLEKEPLGS